MKTTLKLIIIGTVGYSIGAISSNLGYTINTPEYWFVTAPLSILIGAFLGKTLL